jgi:DNA-binding MarR family transcriptional regulator
MKYWFDGEDAQRWGLPAAAVLAHLKYWIDRNTQAGEEPCMTQGMKEMSQYLPFLTVPQIKGALRKLEEAGAIYRQANGFDRRHTYCLGTESSYRRDETVSSKRQNHPIEGTELSHVHIETNTTKRTESNARELEYQRPTEQDVIDYLTDRGAGDLAPTLGPAFWNYYEANGWMVNGTPIAKWKPKANQWINTERNKQSNDRRKGFNAQNFTPDGLRDFIDNG